MGKKTLSSLIGDVNWKQAALVIGIVLAVGICLALVITSVGVGKGLEKGMEEAASKTWYESLLPWMFKSEEEPAEEESA